MTSNQTGFLNRLQIRTKINITVAIIFAFMIIILTIYNVKRESARMLEGAQKEVKGMNTMYFDSLNTMMLTGTMDQRDILNKKVLSRDGVIEARVIRGQPVKDQFGPGLLGDQPIDELDTLALSGKEIQEIVEKNGRRMLTVITPFKATENTRGVNCLQCHKVKSGDVNGAVRISYSLSELDKAVRHEMWMSIGGGAAFLVLSLLFLNVFFTIWVINPLKNLMDTVTKRAKGDMSARAVIKSANDEIGKVASAFNEMSDNMDETAAREYALTQREQEATKALRTKVDKLLLVVNRVAEGDFAAEVNFAGEGSIGDLAKQLQNMINHIRKFSEEREQTLESLQRSVDNILSVVTKAANGDLTGQLDSGGDEAIAQLGSGIQQMMNNLNTLVRQVQHSGIQLASAVTSIVATSKEQEATASEQAATANEIVTTATEISAISKELVSTMDEVSGIADNTAKAAESGRSGLERMEVVMSRIVGAIGPISSKFEVLNEKAGNISSVVTTITKVADQTNLLSLNAAIEAEKAGEFGFGFSVVAKEIRRLADQTAVSTLDIEQMVKEMQAAVSAGVMSMDRFSQQVRHNVKDVTEVGSQLAQIIEQVETLTPLVENVHQGMHSQSEGASQINQSMILLHEATEQTVEALRESNDAMMQLDVAANDLQSGVSKFKVRKAFEH